MATFDIVSKINLHEAKNAIDQANREVTTRFDFKDTHSHFDLKESKVFLVGPTDFHLRQMKDILIAKLIKRGIDIRSFDFHEASISLKEAKQEVDIKQGIDQEMAKNIVKLIKNSKIKVQVAVQGEQVKVTG